MAGSKKIATKSAAQAKTEKTEKTFNLRLPCTADNDIAGMLQKLADNENRSLNNMVVELIKRASK